MAELILPENNNYNPDRVAEAFSENAYKNGKWLDWVAEVNPDVFDNPDAITMLGGGNRFSIWERVLDTRALTDLGFDGTVLERDEPLLPPLRSYPEYNFGDKTPQELLKDKLIMRSEYYTSPVVREQARLLSKEPIVVPRDLSNVVAFYTGESCIIGESEMGVITGEDGWAQQYEIDIPDGKRLVIDNIPKGSKYDNYPYTEGNPLTRIQVQIYKNPEGYLVADKVLVDEEGNPIILKKHPISLKNIKDEDENRVEVDHDAPETRAMDSLFPSNDRKQEWVNPFDPNDRTIRLLTTTSTWVGENWYDTREISIMTKDDEGSSIAIEFSGGGHGSGIPVEFGVITVRIVDDTSKNIADKSFQ